ncbi:MAG: ribonuclease E/G [Promethearchaeota archaeon]
MTEFNVFIRGIYGTALTKIMKDAGFNIIFPSVALKERFNLEEFSGNYSKDVTIKDRYDKQGISISVKKEVWAKIKDDFPINHSLFPKAIKLKSLFPLNSIHKGIIIKSDKIKRYSLVRLIPDESDNENDLQKYFSTSIGRINKCYPLGSEHIFQVAYEDSGKNSAFLNSGYTVSGDLTVIMPNTKRAMISKKIRGIKIREKLKSIIKKVSTNEFGIILRTASQYASELEILREIQKLRDKYLEIEASINQSQSSIGQIFSEFESFNFIFPNPSKLNLDKIRSEIVPSLPLHHAIKADSKFNTDSLYKTPQHLQHLKILNLIEGIMGDLNATGFNDSINNKFISYYYSNLYSPKTFITIFHHKITGRNIRFRPGIIKKIERIQSEPNQLKIILKRDMLGRGANYDGLAVPIELGDYAVGIYKGGDLYSETIYYSKKNELKGRYFNINTPILLKPDGIHYYDLEIDVVEPLNAPREIIDAELIDKAFELNIISKELYDSAWSMAKKIESGEVLSELENE